MFGLGPKLTKKRKRKKERKKVAFLIEAFNNIAPKKRKEKNHSTIIRDKSFLCVFVKYCLKAFFIK